MRPAAVGTDGLHILHLVSVDIGSDESGAVRAYPDISTAVAGHTVNAAVGTVASHTQLVADSGVPGVGVLVIEHQRTLAVEPDVVHLVGEGLQRPAAAQVLLGDIVCLPDGMLLVGDIATNDATIGINEQDAVFTLAERTDVTLRNTRNTLSISKFVVLLLLHVISRKTF